MSYGGASSTPFSSPEQARPLGIGQGVASAVWRPAAWVVSTQPVKFLIPHVGRIPHHCLKSCIVMKVEKVSNAERCLRAEIGGQPTGDSD